MRCQFCFRNQKPGSPVSLIERLCLIRTALLQVRFVRDLVKMGVPTLDEYLFKIHKVVAVDPWCDSKLTLLDVFTKKGGYGIINRGPLLARIGAMTGLVKKSSDGNPEPSVAQAQTNLEEARMGRGRHCKSDELVAICATLNSSSKIMASLGSIVSADRTKSKKLFAETSAVKSVSIKEDFLIEQVQGGKWKPDPSSPLMPENWDRVLWVVTEIFYVSKLVIAKSSMACSKASMGISELVAFAGPLPVNLRTEVEVSNSKDGTTVFEVSEKGPVFPIGFKAIRLHYDEDGDLLAPGGIKLDIAGSHRPKMRSDINEWLDPNKHPEYHMKDLFEQEPGGSLEALPMFVANEEGEALASKDGSAQEVV